MKKMMINKLINKLIKLIDKTINVIVIIVLLLLIVFAGYALYDSYYVYNGAKLSEDIRRISPEEEDFALSNLQEINSDICAWVKINDTNIDYPVVIGKDNNEYLDKDYKKNYSTAGSIFLDYRNDKDFNDDYIIIYGHNMKTNLMFSDIKKFENVDFFNSHPSGKFYTSTGIYHIDIFGFERVDAFSSQVYGLHKYSSGKNTELINFFEKNAIRKRTLEFTNDSKILLLSTCDAAGSNNRAVLICRLTKLNDDNEIIDSSLREIDRQTKEKEKEKTTKINDMVAPRQTVRVAGVQISTRTILLIVLSIFVVIIFLILIIEKKKHKKKRKHG